jgi:hypothetical protein
MATSLGGKWLYPVLWLILVIWFFKNSIIGHTSPRETVTSSSTSGELKPNSTLSQLTDYYHHLTDAEPPSPNEQAKGLVTANISTSNKVAVIMETRKSAAVIPLILHFSAVLGPDWPVVIYTSAENFGSFSTSKALARHQKSGRIVIRPLAEGLYFPNWDSVTSFLTTTWLWNQLAPAEHILIFQADSILCANAPRSVEDFFQWDYIGAPITPQFGQGYNGGLSLRKRSTMLRVLEEFDWAENPNPRPEDQWYYARYVRFNAEI